MGSPMPLVSDGARIRRLLVPLVGLLWLAACGDAASTDTTIQATTTTASAAATSATTTTAPATTTEATTPVGERVLVYGSSNGCDMPNLSVEYREDWEIYTGKCYSTVTLSDPRVSGREVMDIEIHLATGLEIDKWWTTNNVLTNDGGTWRGESWGSEFFDENGNPFTSGYARYVGEGAYEGLVFHAFLAQFPGFAPPDDPDESYWYSGWIEPAE